MQTLRNEKRTARKEHRCDYCGLKIEKGELYENSAIEDSGEVWTWKNHIDCYQIAVALDMFGGFGEGVDMYYFQESIFESYKDILIGRGVKIDRKYKWPDFKIQLEEVKKKYLSKTKT